MLRKGDFHIHSTASDGFFSPEEVVIAAKSRGVDIMALTDHNTVSGIKEAFTAGRQNGVCVVPAVELSTRFGNEVPGEGMDMNRGKSRTIDISERSMSVHLLGYFTTEDYTDPRFEELLHAVDSRSAYKVRHFLKKNWDRSSSAEHISVAEGIALLKRFGAVAILAHPVRMSSDRFQKLICFDFDSIEAKYCHNTEEDTEYFTALALERYSFYTGGSDYHSNRQTGKQCMIGKPFLNAAEIHQFLEKTGVVVY